MERHVRAGTMTEPGKEEKRRVILLPQTPTYVDTPETRARFCRTSHCMCIPKYSTVLGALTRARLDGTSNCWSLAAAADQPHPMSDRHRWHAPPWRASLAPPAYSIGLYLQRRHRDNVRPPHQASTAPQRQCSCRCSIPCSCVFRRPGCLRQASTSAAFRGSCVPQTITKCWLQVFPGGDLLQSNFLVFLSDSPIQHAVVCKYGASPLVR